MSYPHFESFTFLLAAKDISAAGISKKKGWPKSHPFSHCLSCTYQIIVPFEV